LGARVRERRPRPRGRHGEQRRERHLRHGVDGLPLPAGFHEGRHQGRGLGLDAPDHERFHDDDHEERGLDDHALDDVLNHEERRLPTSLDLHPDRHLPDHLSGHLSDHLSGRLCGRLSGHQCSHVCGHVSDPGPAPNRANQGGGHSRSAVAREPQAALPACETAGRSRGRSRDTSQFPVYRAGENSEPVAGLGARMALEVSHRAYVFEVGRIALDGESRALTEDPRIKKAYLGA